MFPEDFLRAQPIAADSLARRQVGKLRTRYPVSTGALPGAHARGSLHGRRRGSMLQVTQSRRAGLNYAASAKLLFVLAFLCNGYFLRGSPPRLAYLRSTYLSKPLRPQVMCFKGCTMQPVRICCNRCLVPNFLDQRR